MKHQKGNINISVILVFAVIVCIIGFGVYALVKTAGNPKEPAFVPKTGDAR